MTLFQKKDPESGKTPGGDNTYRAIFEMSNDGIIIRDLESLRVLDVNKKACEMFYYPKQEMMKLGLKDFISGPSPDAKKTFIERYELAMNGEPQFFETAVKDRFQRDFWVEVNIKRALIGDKCCLVTLVRNVSERKRAEEQREAFVNTVAHELRTPLAAIKEAVDIISEGLVGPVDAEKGELLSVVKKNIDRLVRFITSVLDFQTLGSSKMAFVIDKNDINETIKECHEIMLPLAKEKGLDIGLKLDSSVPPLSFDKDRILQALSNLVSNSIKFTQKGKIIITTKLGENIVEISVKDTGIGIKKEHIGRLFQRYEQLDGPIRAQYGGTGLGLSITKEIIEKHGGRVWAESEYGKGSEFKFVLPIRERRNR